MESPRLLTSELLLLFWQLHIPLRLLCGGLLFTCNAVMWTFLAKALRYSSSSTWTTVTTTASNFISSVSDGLSYSTPLLSFPQTVDSSLYKLLDFRECAGLHSENNLSQVILASNSSFAVSSMVFPPCRLSWGS